MKTRTCCWCAAALAIVVLPLVQAVEILRWERLPLAVPLTVGQERVVFVDQNVRVGVPASVQSRLRVQSAGGAVYLRASEAIEPTRLQLQDVDSGDLILLDIAAEPAQDGVEALEPVRIVQGASGNTRYGEQHPDQVPDTLPPAPRIRETPVPVILTRYAAQNLYAPLRTVEPVPGVTRVNLRRELDLQTLLPLLPVKATALAAWRLEDLWVTAVRLQNTSGNWLDLDPRTLQGDIVSASFQHATLGPHGKPEDTTVVYLVTRGHGLAQSLLPAIQRFDPAVNLPKAADRPEGDGHAQ